MRIFLKTQFNTLVRHEHETAEPLLRSVLEKCERSDVAANPGLLAPSEREVLDLWEKKSARYSAVEARIEQSLFILRDCSISLDAKL
jgi:DNA-directed RNA polymerase III subunit RPC3